MSVRLLRKKKAGSLTNTSETSEPASKCSISQTAQTTQPFISNTNTTQTSISRPYKITMDYFRQKAVKKTFEEFFENSLNLYEDLHIEDLKKKREIN